MADDDDRTSSGGRMDPVTGLPRELGIDETLDIQATGLTVRVETRRYGKAMTVVDGFRDDDQATRMAKELKQGLATGGTAKGARIELQGDHADRVGKLLQDKGFQVD